jgi:hypothetical protein
MTKKKKQKVITIGKWRGKWVIIGEEEVRGSGENEVKQKRYN